MSTSSAEVAPTGRAGRRLASVSVLPALIVLLVVAVLYSVTLGRYDLSVRDVAYILIDNIHPLVTPYPDHGANKEALVVNIAVALRKLGLGELLF